MLALHYCSCVWNPIKSREAAILFNVNVLTLPAVSFCVMYCILHIAGMAQGLLQMLGVRHDSQHEELQGL